MKDLSFLTENRPPVEAPPQAADAGGVRSLRELIARVSGKSLQPLPREGAGTPVESLPFPFLAIVGQSEMKLALLLNLINPAVGGALLIGGRGTGKTTAVRSLVNLLPMEFRSTCRYGCMPEDVEVGGMEAVCPDCARKYALGEPLAVLDRIRLVELPLNARLEDVIGGLDERAALHDRLRLRRGLLAQADRNLLYVDEVNLLNAEIADAILDAAAMGSYTVRRGPVSASYRARFVLIGSMNPEEGRLRPQILDRFGLRVAVRALTDPAERMEVYRRAQAYLRNPRQVVAQYEAETAQAAEEVQAARQLLPQVEIPAEVAGLGLELIARLNIDSLRAELALFEAARAHAAADNRLQVLVEDLAAVAPMALRMRSSSFIQEFNAQQGSEEQQIFAILEVILKESRLRGAHRHEPRQPLQEEARKERRSRRSGSKGNAGTG